MAFDDYITEQLAREDEEPATEPVTEPVEEPAAEAVEEAVEPVVPAEDPVALLEKRLKDKDEYISRLGNEVGELRKLVETVPQKNPLEGLDLEDVIAERPDLAQQIAVQALQNGDTISYERTLRAWAEVDTFAALSFRQDVKAYEMQQALQAQTLPAQQHLQQLTQREQISQATVEAAQRIPDFAQVLSSVDIDRDPVPVGLLQGIENPATAGASLEALYYWAKGRQSTHVAAATSQADTQRQMEAVKEKKNATVATASSTTVIGDTGDEDLSAFYEAFRQPSPTMIPRK